MTTTEETPPTDQERAETYRKLETLSRPNRFLLMFGRAAILNTEVTHGDSR
jgi:hypothetical protein